MMEAIRYDCLDCYLLLHFVLGNRKVWGAASLREAGKGPSERAVLAEVCQAAESSWTSGYETSMSLSVSFARTDCRTYLAFYHLNVRITAL